MNTSDIDQKIRTRLDDLVEEMADFDDRTIEEYRTRYPENVAAIDAVRNMLGSLSYYEHIYARAEQRFGRLPSAETTREIADSVRTAAIRALVPEETTRNA